MNFAKKKVVSNRRWLILLIYILYSTANSFQWMEYSIISNVIVRYYNVNTISVDWTSIIYMIIYPLIVVPVSYFIEKKGLRFAAIYGGLGTAIAAFIKLFSVHQNRFFIVLLGQGIGSTAQVFILCLPSKIAAVWFKASEVSTACALAVFGTQLGLGLGYVIPSSIVRNHKNLQLVENDLWILCCVISGYMIPVSLLIILFFTEHPDEEAVQQMKNNYEFTFKNYFVNFMNFFKNKGFTLHAIAYGINIGTFAALGTLLNQFILEYFPDSEKDAGRIGFIMVLGGIISSLLIGILLDRTHKYKETTVFLYYGSVISLLIGIVSLKLHSKLLVYLIFSITGIFANAYMPVGFELAVELTHPADECTTTGILNALTQFFGVIITIFLGNINVKYGAFWSLLFQSILLLFGALITTVIPNEKKRQNHLFKVQQNFDHELENLK